MWELCVQVGNKAMRHITFESCKLSDCREIYTWEVFADAENKDIGLTLFELCKLCGTCELMWKTGI